VGVSPERLKMTKYKVSQIGIRNGRERVLRTTNDPFKWFPELRMMLSHFRIKNIIIEADPADGWASFDRVYFKIDPQ